MPFMLLGIGIDDMFVIVQNFDTLEEHTAMLPLHEVREGDKSTLLESQAICQAAIKVNKHISTPQISLFRKLISA